MDVVYPVRPGDVNEELRFSLRSLHTNFPAVRQVWIVGHKPKWVHNVGHIEGNTGPNGHANVYRNVLAAMQHPDVADDVVVFNDDFHVTAPVTEPPIWYRSTLTEHIGLPRLRSAGNTWWKQSLATTLVCLQAVGIPDPLSYELHVPLPAKKGLMAETLERFSAVTPDNPPQWRTLYGNLHTIGGVASADAKVSRPGALPKPFLSTSDAVWRQFARTLSSMFPDPSPWEACTRSL